jgi:hypothetical protein
MTPAPAPIPLPALPTWSDAASITSYVTSLLAGVLGVIVLVHPGFTEPTAVQAAVPSISAVVAGVVQLINIITHRGVQKAAILAHATVRSSGF